jgi:hypothetical protein
MDAHQALKKRSVWGCSLLTIGVVLVSIGVFFAARDAETEGQLAHLADLDARIETAARSASHDYARPALAGCEGPAAVDTVTWRRIYETGDGAWLYSADWQVEPSADDVAAAAELEADLVVVSRLACGPHDDRWPDASFSERPQPPRPLRIAQTLMFVHAAMGPAETCAELTLRALRIGQDAAARSDTVSEYQEWISPSFGGAVAVSHCMRRLGDDDAHAFAEALTQMLDAYPPNSRSFFGDYASHIRHDRIVFLRDEITANAPWGSPFTRSHLPEIEAAVERIEAGGMDWRRYPETLTGTRCGSTHGGQACDIDGDARALMYWRFMVLMAHALAQGEPRRLADRLDLLDGPIGINPRDGSPIVYTPSESRWRAVLRSEGPGYSFRIVISEPRQP